MNTYFSLEFLLTNILFSKTLESKAIIVSKQIRDKMFCNEWIIYSHFVPRNIIFPLLQFQGQLKCSRDQEITLRFPCPRCEIIRSSFKKQIISLKAIFLLSIHSRILSPFTTKQFCLSELQQDKYCCSLSVFYLKLESLSLCVFCVLVDRTANVSILGLS